jgi:hypothetical protein
VNKKQLLSRYAEKLRVKKAFLVTIVLFEFACISYAGVQASSVFPQDKVDEVCFSNQRKKIGLHLQRDKIKKPPSSEKWEKSVIKNSDLFADKMILWGSEDLSLMLNKQGTLYIGPGPDTLLIETDYIQDGDIIIFGDGVLLVDNAKLTLSGQLYAQDQGQAVFRNNAHLHFNQFYVGQYSLWLVDTAKFEATDATVDANGVMHFAQLNDSCTYMARRTDFPDWTFRKAFDGSTLILEDVNHVGDIIVDDSCFVHLTRCDTLMPWLETPHGSVIDIRFPDPDSVDHFEFSEATSGVDGIGYTFLADACCRCWWSLETWPGCDVIINSSQIRGSCIRIPGSDTFSVDGIANYTMHTDFTVPLDDRHIEYRNTYVFWWNWYPLENTVFYIDSCVFGEMIGKGSSETYATRCTHDGATITLSAIDSAFVSFTDGLSQAFVSSWEKATLLLVNTSVVPLWPYQSTNLAHGHSYLLAVNSNFEYQPEALDSALVMFAAIDNPSVGMVDTSIVVSGSAWIDAGPFNPITFDRYRLYWAPGGDSLWTLIEESTSQIHNDSLAIWNTLGMSEGDYDLRLTVWDDATDSLTAFGDITLHSIGSVVEDDFNMNPAVFSLAQNFPNPFNPQTTISYQLPTGVNATLKIYNLLGQEIRTLVSGDRSAGQHCVVWDGKDTWGDQVGSGVYFYQLKVDDHTSQIKKLLLLR